jgi:catechol 2,3-dioxygenase-like lactoylglutathione lyase family enzyme
MSDHGYALHHVQLTIPVGAEDECRAFYVGVLGMEEIAKPPALVARGGLWVRSGSLELHLGVEADFRPARKGHPGILVDDLEALAERLAAAGAEVTWDENFPAFRRFHTFDSVGNRLEFMTPA